VIKVRYAGAMGKGTDGRGHVRLLPGKGRTGESYGGLSISWLLNMWLELGARGKRDKRVWERVGKEKGRCRRVASRS